MKAVSNRVVMAARCALVTTMGLTLLGFGTLALPSCGDGATAPVKSAASLPAQAPRGEWSAAIVDGNLEFKATAGEWQSFTQGATASDVRELRVSGAGAELRLRDGEEELARLWLRGGAHLLLGQDDAGVVVVELVRGQVRLRSFSKTKTRWLEGGELVDLSASDVLLSSDGSKQGELTAVSSAPQRASWTGELATGHDGSALGSLVPAGGDAPLLLESVRVEGLQSGHQALVEIEHRFLNEASQVIEGVFRFPLPAGAALVGLAMDIDGKLMEGELLERDKARQTFEEIVDSMRDPALLEWEPGNVFKLRVFPIEPNKVKRVVVRYLTPLERNDAGLASLRVDVGSPPLQATPPKLSAAFNGEALGSADAAFPTSGTLEFVGKPLGAAYATLLDSGTYTSAVYIAPSAPGQGAQKSGPRDVLVIVDTSRSSLESKPLQIEALGALFDTLSSEDRVKVAASDLNVRELTDTWMGVKATGELARRALLEGEADGASDLGAALDYAKAQNTTRSRADASFEVVYVGDATATWGETAAETLLQKAQQVGAPIHMMTLGKGAEHDLSAQLGAVTGGRVAAPDDTNAVRGWATLLGAISRTPRYTDVELEVPTGSVVYPQGKRSLMPGERLPVVVRTLPGHKPPTEVKVVGQLAGKPVRHAVMLSGALEAPWVSQRWGRQHLAYLEHSGAKREEIVETSLEFGVMSRHTAFLVLESEEAYKRYDIERKERTAQNAPTISGGDLESVGTRTASLSPDRLQPGDPEVRIPAPEDARSVRVIFPFGETKDAQYEPELRVWSVRFLVDQGTADGVYPVDVRIEHADGRIELIQLSYVVDTHAPELNFEIERRGGRVYLHARQHTRQLDALLSETRRPHDEAEKLVRQFGKDARRAELQLADGQVLPMTAIKLAEFRVQLPDAALTSETPSELTVFVWDAAGNLREVDLELSNTSDDVRVVDTRTSLGEELL